ncbi:branched-chain amino acid ABC transporter permease [Candidatus Peregrinibacteria bacterium]|nr:branched-chain amino acid ABC transporter permease [Candidatus Peregrinibacteria bacterium]
MEFDFFAKILLNGIIAGSVYAVLSLGLSLLYGVLRFVNLAHGEIAVIGAYSFYTFYGLLGWPLVPSFLAGMAALFLIILLVEKFTFLPVRDAPTFIPLIVSIGLGILFKNLLILFFGSYPRAFDTSTTSFTLFSDIIRITNIQIIILVVAPVLMAGLWAFLRYHKFGKAIRAISDNKEVSALLGIPVNRIVTLVFLISAFLAGTAGILAAFDTNLHPNLGTVFTIKSFAAVILGGIGSIPGAVLGGYVIGIAENLLIAIPFGHYIIPSGYKDAVAFVALLLILYIKPTGFFGARQ